MRRAKRGEEIHASSGCWREGGSDGCCKAVPTVGFFSQALAARGGQFIELGAAIVFRCAPARLQQALANQAKQAGIERALLDEQRIAGDLPDAQKDAVAVQRAERDRPQNQQIERSGKKLSLVGHVPS